MAECLAQNAAKPLNLNTNDPVVKETEELMRQVNVLYDRKDYSNSIPLLEKCLAIQEKAHGSNDLRVADVLFITAGIYRAQADHARAIPLLRRCVAIREMALGPSDPELLAPLIWMGQSCKAQSANAAAIEYFERYFAIHDKQPNQNDKNSHSLLDSLADLYRFQANYEKALAAVRRSQTIKEGLFGKESKAVANCIHRTAQIYADSGDYEKAQAFFARGLEIRRANSSEDEQFAICLRDVASFVHKRGDVTNALALYQRAAKILEKFPETDGETVAGVLGSLAGFYREQGDFASALALYERCAAILEKEHGPEHPSLASILGGLANLKADLGQYDEALALQKRSLAITEQAYGKQSQQFAVCLGDMALLIGKHGNFAQQLSLDEQSLDILERILGENHPEVAAVLNNIGSVEIDLGNYPDAMKHLRRSLAIKESVFGTRSLEVAIALNNLAALFGMLGDSKTELNLSEQSLAIVERLSGAESPLAAKYLGNVGLAYKRQGQNSQAFSCYSRSLAITEKIYGSENPEVALLLNNLADLYQDQDDLVKAEDFYRKSLSMSVKFLGAEHPDLVVRMNNLATLLHSSGKTADGIATFVRVAQSQRVNLVSQLSQLRGRDSLLFLGLMFHQAEMLHSACAEAAQKNLGMAKIAGAGQLALNKAFLEEIQATFAALEADPRTSTQTLREQHAAVQNQLARLSERRLDPADRDARRRELQGELNQLQAKLAERVGLVAQTVRERNLTVADIAWSLPLQSALVDFIQYRRYDFTSKTNPWRGRCCAAYLTFPLARDSTNVVVERVDLGEAAPINEAVELVCKRMSAGQFGARDLSPALQRLSQLVYAPLAPYLTNVSHLIVCPDGQLSRLPFEMLSVGNKFLVEEKNISYVTSGREVVRIAKPLTGPAATLSPSGGERTGRVAVGKSLVMGNPDFDLDLRSSRRESAPSKNPQSSTNHVQPGDQSQLTLAATRALSRDFRGLKFNPLPGSGIEATNVAKLLGADASLRLGADAREAELKAVVSPRVLHLATHGFFLSNQEIKRTNSPVWNSAFTRPGQRQGGTPNDWENPLVRCGIALAGANHAQQVTNAVSEDGLLTGLEASLLNLQGTELVILSACDSGSGEVKIGEGVMSLRRAFRIAGAETVLASHWKVSDRATSLLMTEFMRRWRSGEPRAKAWREAQLSLLRTKGAQEDFSNPFFWAAFTLTGQWN